MILMHLFINCRFFCRPICAIRKHAPPVHLPGTMELELDRFSC